jgi:hypothetical protein
MEYLLAVSSTNVSNCRWRNIPVERSLMHIRVGFLGQSCLSLKQTEPPTRRIHWTVAVVSRGVDIVEEVPD